MSTFILIFCSSRSLRCPEFGLIFHIIAAERGRKETFGAIGIIYAITSIVLIIRIYCVRADQMFTVDADTRAYFTIAPVTICNARRSISAN